VDDDKVITVVIQNLSSFAFLCALAFAIERGRLLWREMLVLDLFIILKSHDLHASDVRGGCA
jgi:hypothetical protein